MGTHFTDIAADATKIAASFNDPLDELDAVIVGILDGTTLTGDLVLDDGSGDSPSLQFVGGSNDDTAEIFLENDVTAGDSDLVIKLVDAGGDSKLLIRDSGNADVIAIDSDGQIEPASHIVMADAKYIATDQVRARDGDGLALYEDGGKGFFINDNDGYVGWGTATPGYPLDIQAPTGDLLNLVGTTSGEIYIRLQDKDSTLHAARISAKDDTSGQSILRFYTGGSERLKISGTGWLTPGDNKTQPLGSTSARWSLLYAGSSTSVGTSRTFLSTKMCPLCSTQMIRGTGSLCILGEDKDYEVAMCPQCGILATEELQHLSPDKLSRISAAPDITFLGFEVFGVSGMTRKVRVDFSYDDGQARNSTYLGETELADFLGMGEGERKAFLLQLGQREWEALQEIELMQEEVDDLQAALDALVKTLNQTDLKEQDG